MGTLAARPGGTPEDVIGEGVPVGAGGQPAWWYRRVCPGEQRAGCGGGLASGVAPARLQDAHPQRQVHLCTGRNCRRRALPGCPDRVIRVHAGSPGKPRGSQRGARVVGCMTVRPKSICASLRTVPGETSLIVAWERRSPARPGRHRAVRARVEQDRKLSVRPVQRLCLRSEPASGRRR
jgi:hypothetical protein